MPDREHTGQQTLFPEADAEAAYPIARPLVFITRGRIEYGTRCPSCGHMHHHVGLGLRRGPCGALYRLEPKRSRAGRAA